MTESSVDSSVDSSKIDVDVCQSVHEAATFLKNLANPNRLIILGKLLKGELCVGELEKSLDITQSALSQHLSRMRSDGILSSRRDRQQIFYTINDDRVEKFLKMACECFKSR